MTDGAVLAERLLYFAKKYLHLPETDEIYTRNLLLGLFKVSAPAEEANVSDLDGVDRPDILVSEIESYAAENGLIKEGEEDLYSSFILGLLTPPPSVVNENFSALLKSGPADATAYLYRLSVMNNYIRKSAIEKNVGWICDDGKTGIEVTVNLSKPEKDNKDIAKLLKAKDEKKYPRCALCGENEGYYGSPTHPPRTNLRTVSVRLGGEDWFVQYSPYAYFEEHCIAVNRNHVPMKISADTPVKLLDFVDIFHDYFIGSNAALPIVGGSILNHEHYQGGKHFMPMLRADILTPLKASDGITAGIVDWYNSVLRIESEDRKKIEKLAARIIAEWENYTDERVGILARTNAPHNTLSPICYRKNGGYTMDLILRNNRTSEEYPDGIYHAHPEHFNIKKEGIGLIEAMGQFILPGRLKRQNAEICDILTGKQKYDPAAIADPASDLFVHRHMVEKLVGTYGTALREDEAEKNLREHINGILKEILNATAVFKNDAEGKAAFLRFAAKAGLEPLSR